MGSAEEQGSLLVQVGEIVRAILRRKSGMSLREDDPRRDNQDAIELVHDVILRLWERHGAAPDRAWDDLGSYAASVTYNAWSDHLREKYPKRASLKNRLRYFVSHQPRYASWNSADGELLIGLHGWQLGGTEPVSDARVAALRDGRERLAPASVPRKDMERYAAEDWDRLLSALFERLQAPITLDDLVSVAATLLKLQEDRTESLDEMFEDENAPDLPDPSAESPQQRAEVRSMLHQLWGAVLALKPDYRTAYLLNLPGAGKTRGDIEVFLIHGIASIPDMASAVGLDAEQYQIAFAQLELDVSARAQVERCSADAERFQILWYHLPLLDSLIGTLLRLEAQQVINRRMLALRELARLMAHAPGRRRPY
ncbi:MAG: hypothetical protein ACKVOX_08605 [Rhizobacter sp.]